MTNSSKTVTRFAPSPTGFLHIGGARTALFNWLYAKHTGGTFLLRIEDTDRARSTDAAVEAILDGLRWLGLDWDGEPVMQFARAARHAAVAAEMLERGQAFRCYVTPEALEKRRAEANDARTALTKARDAAVKASEKGSDASEEDKAGLEARITELQAETEEKMRAFRSPYRDGGTPPMPDAPFVIRLKAPQEGETVVDDQVQGRVTWANKDLDDMVLLRSDGTPTYMLAVVVDDRDMGVTHIVRGDDHLTNAARQSQIYAAMGWDTPEFAHIPLIHGADGAKLSKRHGALGVDAYRAMGYLPDAMRNYLARLGWGHGDDEIFSTGQAIEWFDLDGIGRSPSRFDLAKLESINAHYMRTTPDAELVAQCRAIWPAIAAAAHVPSEIDSDTWRKLEMAMPGIKERAKTLADVPVWARFLFVTRPLVIEAKAAKSLGGEARRHLTMLHARLSQLDPWSASAIEEASRGYADEGGMKLGDIAQPLRAALTGRTTSPPVFDVAFVLGREETLARIAGAAGK